MPYEAAPGPVRAWVERALGSQVVAASTQIGGFSPGVAARLVTASGRRAFVKAVGAELNERSPELFRQEIVAMRALDPLRLTHAPRLCDVYDDGAWVALLLEDVAGRTAYHPWTGDDAARVLGAVVELGAALTPSPWPDAPVAAERSGEFLSRWKEIVADGIEVPAWIGGRVDEVADLADRGLAALAGGESLVHWDLRADNLLVTDDGRVVFVDWAWAARAPAWADQAILQADMRVATDHPAIPDLPDDDGIDGFIAAVAGGLWWGSLQPDPPGLPTLRRFQRESADACFRWLRGRLGW
jgi:hypothetical protein